MNQWHEQCGASNYLWSRDPDPWYGRHILNTNRLKKIELWNFGHGCKFTMTNTHVDLYLGRISWCWVMNGKLQLNMCHGHHMVPQITTGFTMTDSIVQNYHSQTVLTKVTISKFSKYKTISQVGINQVVIISHNFRFSYQKGVVIFTQKLTDVISTCEWVLMQVNFCKL